MFCFHMYKHLKKTCINIIFLIIFDMESDVLWREMTLVYLY